jgi:hypothetical protein
VPERQYSDKIEDYLFKPTTEISWASVNRADQIILEAKAIMKKRRMQETLQQKKQRIEYFKKQKQKLESKRKGN